MDKEIAALHYLTQDLSHYYHEDQVRIACEAGVRWVQLRVKNKNQNEWLEIARHARAITNEFDAILIINDNPFIAKEVKADGVHLGKDDMHWKEARKMLGDELIIGVSIHSLLEIVEANDAGVDYFGLGPFRFTSTKEKLNPVFGAEGIRQIVSASRDKGISKPIIAIGGIRLNDVNELIEAGANGIAVSSAINLAADPKETIKNFLHQFKSLNKTIETISR